MTNASISSSSELAMMPISAQGKEASDRFQVALRAIMTARREGRISKLIAASRLSYLTCRFDQLTDPLQQIAACEAMIMTCERAGR